MKSSSQLNYRSFRLLQQVLTYGTFFGSTYLIAWSAIAQTQIPPRPSINPQIITPNPSPSFPQSPPRLPSPDELLKPSSPPTSTPTENNNVSGTIVVKRFNVLGSSVFSEEELNQVLIPFTNRPITFPELLQARSAISDLYINKGFITSGAFIPPQNLTEGIVKIQVVEGSLQEIKVSGGSRLSPDYIRSRLNVATGKPLNRDRLVEALQVLQLNPLIASLSAELAAGDRAGQNILDVTFTEAKSSRLQLLLDNNRAPSVGTFRRRLQYGEGNVTGLGDSLTVGYSNTDGSNAYDLSYSIPINPYNGSISISFNNGNSNVIEQPFNALNIYSNSTAYDLTYRQPILQTPSKELALGLTASYRESLASLLAIPFPLSAGADNNGVTKLSVLRFFQEYTQRSSDSVFAMRSQFSLGLGLLGATINNQAPDARFFAWRGQAQYVNLLAPDTLLLLRGDVQLADRTILPLEQIGLGGQDSLRGYRQDLLFGDNGTNLSAELRIPVLRVPEIEGLMQLTPFVDAGIVWASSGEANPPQNVLVSTGLGLRWTMGDRLSARLDYGIPLVSVQNSRKTLQESGVYFSLTYNLF
ncbi:ShlB/FhaC/HecB family hemolysin secretion/activation protein [Pseudanabaena sp. FACHB-1998]|uniref:ShlB/FhaC/HecB family hemolysin secretion/activation protein n=1 Tax=Pseudanabaena sp. FACHB-1998 TaxID=2692858 RepID=UPI0016813AF3|nr:ShlB/FhaC/HecB family hemolysin secretion/activation protein [Pseudanabaena sp. FACHB-1998]MBD2176090.1 ShlB/FhaC/HecB family hemolysin secretion/activation protein [Pseudanabaena sp. FACHB-1998]